MNPTAFFKKNSHVAVVGVSQDPKKWGRKIYDSLLAAGINTVPINPKHNWIGTNVCYPNLKSLPHKPSMVITVVAPKVSEQVVKQCIELGIKKVWMQPGSESEKAISLCKENNISAVHDLCIVVDLLGNREGN